MKAAAHGGKFTARVLVGTHINESGWDDSGYLFHIYQLAIATSFR